MAQRGELERLLGRAKRRPQSTVEPDEYTPDGRRKLRARTEKFTGARRYAAQDHEYVISWYSDKRFDVVMKRTLARLGIPMLISPGPERISYKLLSRSEVGQVYRHLRESLLFGGNKPGPRHKEQNPFEIMETTIKEIHQNG